MSGVVERQRCDRLPLLVNNSSVHCHISNSLSKLFRLTLFHSSLHLCLSSSVGSNWISNLIEVSFNVFFHPKLFPLAALKAVNNSPWVSAVTSETIIIFYLYSHTDWFPSQSQCRSEESGNEEMLQWFTKEEVVQCKISQIQVHFCTLNLDIIQDRRQLYTTSRQAMKQARMCFHTHPHKHALYISHMVWTDDVCLCVTPNQHCVKMPPMLMHSE